MKRFIFLCLACQTLTVSAQSIFRGFDNLTQNALRASSGGKSDVTGSPYLQDDFTPGRIKNVPEVQSLRYNAAEDNFEFRNNGANYIIPKQESYDEITFTATGETYKFRKYTNKAGNPTMGYLVELYKANDMGLYRRDIVTLRRGKASNGYEVATPDAWVKGSPEFYILQKNGNIEPFPKNAKAIAKMYPAKAEDIKVFFKQNKYDFDKKEDLIKIVDLLTTF